LGPGPVIIPPSSKDFTAGFVDGINVINDAAGTASEGTTDVPEGTTDIPEDTTDSPKDTTDAPEDTTTVPEGTTDAPEGPTDAPEGTADALKDTTTVPEGTTDSPKDTTDAPEGTTTVPEGTTNATEGTTDAANNAADATDEAVDTTGVQTQNPQTQEIKFEASKTETTVPEPSLTYATISEIIDICFQAGVTGKNSKKVIAGFKKHVHASLACILENTNAGEQEDQKFFVFVQHNAIIRIDIKLWRYNFNSTKVLAEAEDVLAYLFAVSVVNHLDLSVDELTYLLTEHAGDEDVTEYVDYLLGVWKKIYAIKKEVNTYKFEWEFKLQKLREERRVVSSTASSGFLEAPPAPFRSLGWLDEPGRVGLSY
jgi:hypothetical protein